MGEEEHASEEEKEIELMAAFDAGLIPVTVMTQRSNIWQQEKALKEATHPDPEFLTWRTKVEKMEIERHGKVTIAEAALIENMEEKEEGK